MTLLSFCFLHPCGLFLLLHLKHAFVPSLQAREVGQCLATEVDSVSLRMKQRITSIPEMQNLSKEVGQLTKVRITLLYRKSPAGAHETHDFFPIRFPSYRGR